MTTLKRGVLISVVLVTVALAGCKNKKVDAVPVSGTTAGAAAVVAAPTSKTVDAPFNVLQVPETTVALPPFPYVDFPTTLPEASRSSNTDLAFDEVEMIAGAALHKVAGRVSRRSFSNSEAGLSAAGSRRNYEQAITALGGVKVNTASPADATLIAANGGDRDEVLKRLNIMVSGSSIKSYDVYLIRSAQGNVWVSVLTDVDDLNTFLTVVQEKPLPQLVGYITADTLAKTLQTQGHVALYLSFDTDRDVLRADSAPVLDEVVKLLRANTSLQLNVEGHTDNVGDAAHNQTLSTERAKAVVAALTAKQIDAGRLRAAGFGATRPVSDNDSEAGRAKNRRVELVRR